MESNEDKDKRHNDYFKKLIQFCKAGDLVQVAACVKIGCNIRLKNNLAIETAARYGHIEILKYFFSKSMTQEDIDTVILISSENGNLSIIEYLYKKNNFSKQLIQKSLIESIKNNHFNIIKFWYSKNIIEQEDSIKLLEFIVSNNNISAFKFLKEFLQIEVFCDITNVYLLAQVNSSTYIINYLESLKMK